MDGNELRELAQRVIDDGGKDMVLVLFRSTEPRGNTVRLLGREGPRGCFLDAEQAGKRVRVTAYFNAAEIVAYCDKNLVTTPARRASHPEPDTTPERTL